MRCLLAIALLPACTPAWAAPVDYSVDIVAPRATSAPIVMITVNMRGNRDGTTELDLPNAWAGRDQLWRNVSDVRVRGGALVQSGKPELLRIRHRPGAMLTIRYRVTDPDPKPPGPGYEKAIPVIEPGWFYLHGEGVFMVPTGGENRAARFRWGQVPRGWQAKSDLDAPPPALTANQVASSALFGGTDLRLIERNVGGQTVRFALRGTWSFADADLADRTARIIATENALMGNPARPYFIPLAPLTNPTGKARSYGGTGRTGGFALAATSNVPINAFARLLAHEYGHRWFGGQFGPFEDGARDYWFTEGFNDWFAAQALVESGLWGVAEWTANANALLKQHSRSRALKLTAVQLDEQFWTDNAAMQFSYDRGFLIALVIDSALRDAGKPPLGTIIRSMAQSAPPPGLREPEWFSAKLETVLPGALARAQAMIPIGGPPVLPPALMGECGQIAMLDGVPQIIPVAGNDTACKARLAAAGQAP